MKKKNIHFKSSDLSKHQWFEAMIEHSPVLMIRNREDATITYINQAVCKTFGLTKEGTIGKKWLTELNTEEKEKIYTSLEQANKDLTSFKNVIVYRTKDGEEKIVEWNTAPIFDSNGKFTGEYQSVGFDITNKITTEQVLHQKEIQLEVFFKQSLDGFFFMQIDFPVDVSSPQKMEGNFEKLFANLRITKVNKAFADQYQLAEDEMIGLTPLDFFKHDLQQGRTVLQEIIHKHTVTILTDERKKDGTNMWVEGNYYLIQNEKDEITGLFGIQREVTESKKLLNELIASEESYRKLFNSINDAIYILDRNGTFIDVNESAETMFGYSKEYFIGKKFSSLSAIGKNDSNKTESLINDVFSGKGSSRFEFWGQRKSGEEFPSEIALTQGMYYNKDVIIAIGRDIFERKKSEEKLREINVTKDKFFSIIAHDLRSPFQGLLGIASILTEEEDLTLQERTEYERKLFDGLKSQFNLLDDLLTWSRVQRGILEFHPLLNFIHKDVEEALFTLTSNAEKKILKIGFDIPEDVCACYDRHMITTVIRNLLSNAIKFTPVGGEIKVSSKTTEDGITFSVQDSGIGISQEDIKKLFKIDTQFVRRGTMDEGGTGLGLLLCKEFIDKHLGKIWIESEVGKGSTFSFSLPRGGGL